MSARRTAVTGIGSFLGSRLLRRLAEAHGADRVVAVDVAPPPRGLGVRRREIDLLVLVLLVVDEGHAALFSPICDCTISA